MKAILALIVVVIIAAVVVVFFILGGSDDEDGGEIAIAVQVKNADNLGAIHIELVYDAAILEASEVKLGDLGENGQVDYDLATPGRVVIGVIDAMGMNGSGDIVEVSFDEKKSGRSQLNLENVMATDAETLYDLVAITSSGSIDTEEGTSKAPVINLGP